MGVAEYAAAKLSVVATCHEWFLHQRGLRTTSLFTQDLL